MASSSVEVKFAQNLAANEKKKRDKSLKKLRKFLRLKSSKKDGFNEEDFLKLWKGLHYCMWMQDKPLIQEELSSSLSTLVHDLETLDGKLLFVKTFFITEAREWNSIDRWRIDKFMMLMRNILHELFVVNSKQKWREDAIGRTVEVIKDTVLDHTKDSIPDGIRTHLADIYLAELKKVVNNQLDGKKLLKLLTPFCDYILKAQNTAIVKRVISRVFEPIINQAVKELERKIGGDKTVDDDIETETDSKNIKFDNKLLADHLFQLSNGKDCLTRNRPLVYDIVKRLQDVEAGVLPKKEVIVVKPGLSRQDVSEAVHSLTKLQETGDSKQKKKKRRKKDKENLDSNNNEDDTENSTADTDSQDETDVQSEKTNKQRKRKHSAGTDITDTPEPLTKIKKKQTSKDNVVLDTSSVKKNNISLNTPKKTTSDKVSESDSETADKKTEHDRKRKHSGSSKGKDESIKDNAEDEKIVLVGDKIQGDNSSAKKRRKSDLSDAVQSGKKGFKTVIEVRKNKKKNVWTETCIEDTETSENKTDNADLSRDHTASQSEDIVATTDQHKTDGIQNGKGENSDSDSPRKKKKNQKSKKSALINSDENDVKSDKTNMVGNKAKETETSGPKTLAETTGPKTPAETSGPKTPAETSGSKTSVTDNLQEGEIEIWVPNKKYKGNKPSSPGSTFAKFEKTKAPAAFVKKALTKIKKQPVSESKGKDDSSSSLKGLTGSASGKKVKFDMKKNKALAFKDSLQISPLPPFHPDKKPDQGILKPSPLATPGQSSLPGQRKHNVTMERRSSLPGAMRMSSRTTPVTVLPTKQKRKSLPRARAFDFFS